MKQPDLKSTENSSTLLFVFSGTGNSLHTAMRIQANIDNCEILSTPKVIEDKKYNYQFS